MGEPGMPSPVVFSVEIDPANPQANAAFARIGGLGLPDRDYYLSDTIRNVEIRTVSRLSPFLLGKAGYDSAMADKVYEFEHQIALADWDRALARNPLLTHTVIPHADFLGWSSDFPLALVEGSGLGKNPSLIVREVPPSPELVARLGLSPSRSGKAGRRDARPARLLGTGHRHHSGCG
jgi:putative endopeptidase